MDGQAETPPVSAGFQGTRRAVAFDPSEMLGRTGPPGWTSRPGSMMPDTAGAGEGREVRNAMGTPLIGGGGSHNNLATLGGGGSNLNEGPAIKVYQRSAGGSHQAADGPPSRADRGGDAGVGTQAARSDSKMLYTMTREETHGGRVGGRAAGAGRARASVDGGMSAHEQARMRRARMDEEKPLAGRRGAGRAAAGNGLVAGKRGPGAGRGRGVKAGSEEDVFDKHEPTIISASSRLIFYTGPATQQAPSKDAPGA
jgi:hypothetical protein